MSAARWAELEHRRKLIEISQQVETGELVIRQATPAELEEWAARRAQREAEKSTGSQEAGHAR